MGTCSWPMTLFSSDCSPLARASAASARAVSAPCCLTASGDSGLMLAADAALPRGEPGTPEAARCRSARPDPRAATLNLCLSLLESPHACCSQSIRRFHCQPLPQSVVRLSQMDTKTLSRVAAHTVMHFACLPCDMAHDAGISQTHMSLRHGT